MTTSRADTVAGEVRAEDSDGIDSIWVTLDTMEIREDGGFSQVFRSSFRFLVDAGGRTPGEQIPLRARARDITGFVVQRDTYVVVVP